MLLSIRYVVGVGGTTTSQAAADLKEITVSWGGREVDTHKIVGYVPPQGAALNWPTRR